MRASLSFPLSVVLIAGLGACDRQTPVTPQPATVPPSTVSTSASEPEATIDKTQRGSAMPADRFVNPAGNTVTLGDFKGKPLLVNLWATWCGPCVKEMPSLDRLAADRRDTLQVLVVNQDSAKQAVDPVPDWWRKAKLTALQLYRDPENNLGFAFGGGMLPTTVLYGADGKEIWRVIGGFDWEGEKAKALLAEASGGPA